MADKKILVQGDTLPTISANLTYDDGSIVNLDGASVAFQMRPVDGKQFVVNASGTITNASGGAVAYMLAANDLNVPGDYNVQWKVTFPGDKVQTTAIPNVVTIRRD